MVLSDHHRSVDVDRTGSSPSGDLPAGPWPRIPGATHKRRRAALNQDSAFNQEAWRKETRRSTGRTGIAGLLDMPVTLNKFAWRVGSERQFHVSTDGPLLANSSD